MSGVSPLDGRLEIGKYSKNLNSHQHSRVWMVSRAPVAPRVERELFPRTRHDTEWSSLHDRANLAMRTCASMKQLDK